MKIITIVPGHNATIGYFDDGECISILHEEKFNNIKNFSGFPEQALAHILSRVPVGDIDKFIFTSIQQFMLCVPGAPSKKLADQIETVSQSRLRRVYDWLEYKTGLKAIFTGLRNVILHKFVSPKAWEAIVDWMRATYDIPCGKIVAIDHHLCHALTPVYFYGLASQNEKILLVTVDGAGDDSSSKVFVFDPADSSCMQLASTCFDSSIGLIYAEATKYLGMKPGEHEYKVMGLAAYVADEKYFDAVYRKLKSIIWLNKERLEFQSKFNTNVARLFYRENFAFVRFDNIAAATQKLTEDMVAGLIGAAIEKTGIRKVAVSGGVFMNVKMNQKIAAMPDVEKIYFQPSCGDESLAIGGACKEFLGAKIFPKAINTMYLGHSFSNDDVEAFLRRKNFFDKYEISLCENIEHVVAELLANFNIVARFSGSCEWGARSLCNRGILGNASDLKTFFEVNDMIKMRDFWMPFAPTILSNWCSRYIQDWDILEPKVRESSKFMIVTFDSTELARQHLCASIHQKDKTLRPQVVDEADNPKLFNLLKKYEDLTGMGGVMNTSLNIHGYPMVGTLEQAVFTFENSGLKYMALENWLIKKVTH